MMINLCQTIKKEEDMGHIDKHLLLSEETCEVLRRRDKKRFPLERDFINEAVLSYGDRITQEKILKEIRKVREQITRLNQTVGWE